MEPSDTEQETLLEFPCEFPIKAIGRMGGFRDTVMDILRPYVPDLEQAEIKIASSRNAGYMSVTVTIIAVSRAQLDTIYMALTEHPDVLMAF